MIIFLFWFLRLLCLVGVIVNIVVVDVHNFASLMSFIFGLLAATNLYVIGLVAHETYRKLPIMFVLCRVVQLAIMLATKSVKWQYLALYASIDLVTFLVFIYDSRYSFILERTDKQSVKTLVERDDIIK